MNWLDKCVQGSRKKYPRKYAGDIYVEEVEDEVRKNRRQHVKFVIDEELSAYWEGSSDGNIGTSG